MDPQILVIFLTEKINMFSTRNQPQDDELL